ncbi:hypothetical protein [Thermoleptolyngbya sp.]|jgi:hypothetical protein
MILTLSLPPELEDFLIQEADRHELSIETLALQLLSKSILLEQHQTKAVKLLQSWIDDEDLEEQRETGQYLIEALDRDRLSDRQLFH